MDSLSRGSGAIINLTDTPTEEALASAALCESVKVAIVNLTPSKGPVEIPVRIIEPTMEQRIEAIERSIWNHTTDPIRFMLLQDIYRIMQ